MDTNQTFMCHSGAISRLYCCGIISNLARNWSSNIFVILVDRIHRCAVSLKMCPFHLNCVVLDSTDELNVCTSCGLGWLPARYIPFQPSTLVTLLTTVFSATACETDYICPAGNAVLVGEVCTNSGLCTDEDCCGGEPLQNAFVL